MIKNIIYVCTAIFSLYTLPLMAQETHVESSSESKRAWEIGLGGSVFHMPRVGLKSVMTDSKGHLIDISKRDLVFGGQIYVARELSDHFALDLQGTFGYAKDPVRTVLKDHYIGLGTLGLQWRLGGYFGSKTIDPFVRIGAGYMYKNFRINYMDVLDGTSLNNTTESGMVDNDRTHLLPITAGLGLNMWLNDRFGIGMQADYIHLPYKGIADPLQGSVRLMWRIGGKSKKTFVKVPVEKIVEREVIREVEKIVSQPSTETKTMYKLFSGIYFEFASADFTTDTYRLLDEIAETLKSSPSSRLCIIGCTDAIGTAEYNKKLSERRAKAVVDALIERGVSSQMLKWRGVGSEIAHAPKAESDGVRRGDRKVIVEVIENEAYWESLK